MPHDVTPLIQRPVARIQNCGPRAVVWEHAHASPHAWAVALRGAGSGLYTSNHARLWPRSTLSAQRAAHGASSPGMATQAPMHEQAKWARACPSSSRTATCTHTDARHACSNTYAPKAHTSAHTHARVHMLSARTVTTRPDATERLAGRRAQLSVGRVARRVATRRARVGALRGKGGRVLLLAADAVRCLLAAPLRRPRQGGWREW